MKRVVAGVVCFVAAVSPGMVQAERENSLRDGAWALQFEITDFLDLSDFAGGVSFKWQMSDKSALRFGVAGSTSAASQEITDAPATGENDGFSVTISPSYQRYINPRADANFYWGVGPFFGYSSFSQEQSADSSYLRRDEDSYSIGVLASIGIEWFAIKEISFHAEYLGSGQYQKTTQEQVHERAGQPTDVDRLERSSWNVGTNGAVRFGLSVYF